MLKSKSEGVSAHPEDECRNHHWVHHRTSDEASFCSGLHPPSTRFREHIGTKQPLHTLAQLLIDPEAAPIMNYISVNVR